MTCTNAVAAMTVTSSEAKNHQLRMPTMGATRPTTQTGNRNAPGGCGRQPAGPASLRRALGADRTSPASDMVAGRLAPACCRSACATIPDTLRPIFAPSFRQANANWRVAIRSHVAAVSAESYGLLLRPTSWPCSLQGAREAGAIGGWSCGGCPDSDGRLRCTIADRVGRTPLSLATTAVASRAHRLAQ